MATPELTPEEYRDYCELMRRAEAEFCAYCGGEIDPQRYYVTDKDRHYHLGCVMEMEAYGDMS